MLIYNKFLRDIGSHILLTDYCVTNIPGHDYHNLNCFWCPHELVFRLCKKLSSSGSG